MPANQVLIISPNELFRAGLQRVLTQVPGMHLVATVATQAEAVEQVGDHEVNLVLIEQNGNQAEQVLEISQLLGLPGERLHVIALSLKSTQMKNYQRQHIPGTSVESFINAIESG